MEVYNFFYKKFEIKKGEFMGISLSRFVAPPFSSSSFLEPNSLEI